MAVLDPEICWRAWMTHDRRFDGRVFMGVSSTGIYCRPICPARLPAQRHCAFFKSAAAAEASGYRPCRRCRPETAPGSPAWFGTSAVVRRALRLIEEGALDEGSVEDLSLRLGVTSRWLRALFVEHVGASPIEVALTRRVHFARKLLGETRLPVADIAVAAGFGSSRRLRDAFGRTFQRPPSDVRRSAPPAAAGALALRLPACEPFDPAPLLSFFSARAIPGVEQVEGSTYRRTIEVDGKTTTLEIAADERGLELRIAGVRPRSLPRITTTAGRLFDLDTDAAAIAAHLSRDPVLRNALSGRTVRVPGAWHPFEVSVRALLGQQVSVAAARTLAGRLVRLCGEPLARAEGALTHVFPSPAALAEASLEKLGLPRARAVALSTLARAVADGSLDLAAFEGAEQLLPALTALPGLGPWTAQYIAMRALRDPDAFPAGDLGVRRALVRPDGTLPNQRAVLDRAERWRPWRAYAAVALWTQQEAAAKTRRASVRRRSRPVRQAPSTPRILQGPSGKDHR